MIRRAGWNSILGLGACGLLLASITISTGCAPREALQYADAEGLSEIPERHQEQVRDYLREYFGTPDTPMLRIPADEQDESGDTVTLVDKVDRSKLKHGAEVYRLRCAGCHGITGNGQGEVFTYLDPKPRDYRKGIFKFKSTERAAKPLRSDLERILRYGAKGTSMPAFRWLPEEDLEAVIDYVILLSRRGEMELALIRESEVELDEEDDYDPFIVAEEYAVPIDESWEKASQKIVRPAIPEPAYTKDSVLAGAKLFVGDAACKQCHGSDGRGGKESFTAAATAKDDWGYLAYAADLTSGMLHGGRRPIDVYRRIHEGINGAPMSGFGRPPSSPEDVRRENAEDIWNLTHFVLSLSNGDRYPEVDEILRNAAAAKKTPTPEETPAEAETPEGATGAS